MPITTGSFPKGLGGSTGGDDGGKPKIGKSASDEMAGAGKSGSDCTKDFMRGMEEGYSPRRAMAAGIVKC